MMLFSKPNHVFLLPQPDHVLLSQKEIKRKCEVFYQRCKFILTKAVFIQLADTVHGKDTNHVTSVIASQNINNKHRKIHST